MFATLIESKAGHTTRTRWLLASAVIHLMLLGGVSAYSPSAHGSSVRDPIEPRIVWVAPRQVEVATQSSATPGGGAAGPSTTERALPRPGQPVFVDVPDVATTAVGVDGDVTGTMTASAPLGGRGGSPLSSGNGGPMWASQVERVALPHPGNRPPVYPQVLNAARIEGSVTMRFVIDTTGAVEPESPVVVRTDHPLFTAAVLRALASHRFLPAESGGTKVRMLVEQRFEFSLTTR